MNLLRLAVPARKYLQEHLDDVAEAILYAYAVETKLAIAADRRFHQVKYEPLISHSYERNARTVGFFVARPPSRSNFFQRVDELGDRACVKLHRGGRIEEVTCRFGAMVRHLVLALAGFGLAPGKPSPSSEKTVAMALCRSAS